MNTPKVIVDLTEESDDDENNENATEKELVSQTEMIAKMSITKQSNQKLNLSSPEILALSPFRKVKMLPDIICKEQKQGLNKLTHRKIMEAEMNAHSLGSPEILIENEVDQEWAPPFHFAYLNDYLIDKTLDPPSLKLNDQVTVGKGCDCKDDICDPQKCKCRSLHTDLAPDYYHCYPKGQFAYQSDGLLYPDVLFQEDMPIWECNDDCACHGHCTNNVVNKGRKVGLILFKHEKKGWCVKLAEDVKAGQYIELYAGELISPIEANRRNLLYSKLNNTYVMDITPYHLKWHAYAVPYLHKIGKSKDEYVNGKLEFMNEETAEQREEAKLRILDDLVEELEKNCEEERLLSIDGALFGNISRYLAHSCEPNLIRHMVYTYERDLRRPFVAFFAKENLKAGQEITIHYEGISDHKGDSPHSQQMHEFYERLETMKCHCETPNCSGYVFNGRDITSKARM